MCARCLEYERETKTLRESVTKIQTAYEAEQRACLQLIKERDVAIAYANLYQREILRAEKAALEEYIRAYTAGHGPTFKEAL